jgi:hypothetical protein
VSSQLPGVVPPEIAILLDALESDLTEDELAFRGVSAEVSFPVCYKGQCVSEDAARLARLVIERKVIVELAQQRRGAP